jgi:hypothetical protein
MKDKKVQVLEFNFCWSFYQFPDIIILKLEPQWAEPVSLTFHSVLS